ncbi:hypothetical protein BOX15_Mlig034499g2 [Macrostomum lignano]|uniref:Uncharacterized protein n=1 Tax=Macrostomum lignano TaxID=282301 RepID=A0A267DFA8_9PLAT|nr:hypothetical protein BOX15_Mlig034499g5 [Macrostomum lignano]PAA56402.1 hypothetical protein BOX15_Mlig034499g2 [Macrostomum lignano]
MNAKLLAYFLIFVLISDGERVAGFDVNNINSVDVGSDGVSVTSDNGNPFYYDECSGSLSGLSIQTGCHRRWKPLFYVCAVVGGIAGLFLVTGCCCCCCCTCCRSKSATPAAAQPPVVVMSSVAAPSQPHLQQQQQPPPPPKY